MNSFGSTATLLTNLSQSRGDLGPTVDTDSPSPALSPSPGRVSSVVRFSSIRSMSPSHSSHSLHSTSRSDTDHGAPSSSGESDPSRQRQNEEMASATSDTPRPGSGYTRSSSYRRSNTASTLNLRRPYPSTKLKGEIEKPWTKYPDPAHRWARVIFWALVTLGFAVGVVSEFSVAWGHDWDGLFREECEDRS